MMPALSPMMEVGTLSKWLVKEGDTVSSGDVIAQIETDKATMEVEAVDEGTIAKILVEAGTENVKVNSVIAMLAEEGEDADSVEAPSQPTETKSDVDDVEAAPEVPDEVAEDAAGPKPDFKPSNDPEIPEGTSFKETTIRDALRDAMAEEMRRDESVFVMGEEVAQRVRR